MRDKKTKVGRFTVTTEWGMDYRNYKTQLLDENLKQIGKFLTSRTDYGARYDHNDMVKKAEKLMKADKGENYDHSNR